MPTTLLQNIESYRLPCVIKRDECSNAYYSFSKTANGVTLGALGWKARSRLERYIVNQNFDISET